MAPGLTVLTFRFKVQSKGVLELCCLGLPLSGLHSGFPLPSSTVPRCPSPGRPPLPPTRPSTSPVFCLLPTCMLLSGAAIV